MLLLLVRFCTFYFSMLEQQCPAKVLTTQNQNIWSEVWTRVLLSTEHSCCVTMKMMSKEQLTLSLSLLPETPVLPPMTLKDPDSLYELFSHLPSSQPERQPRLAWTCSRREPTDQRIYSTVRQKPTREKHLVCLFICLSVWLIDHPTTIALPEIAVRLPFWWTSSFF